MLRACARVSPASRTGRWAPLRSAIRWWLALAGRRGCRAGPASPLLWLLPSPTVPSCSSRATTAKPARSLSPAPAATPVPPAALWPAIRAATPRLGFPHQAALPGSPLASAHLRGVWSVFTAISPVSRSSAPPLGRSSSLAAAEARLEDAVDSCREGIRLCPQAAGHSRLPVGGRAVGWTLNLARAAQHLHRRRSDGQS